MQVGCGYWGSNTDPGAWGVKQPPPPPPPPKQSIEFLVGVVPRAVNCSSSVLSVCEDDPLPGSPDAPAPVREPRVLGVRLRAARLPSPRRRHLCRQVRPLQHHQRRLPLYQPGMETLTRPSSSTAVLGFEIALVILCFVLMYNLFS